MRGGRGLGWSAGRVRVRSVRAQAKFLKLLRVRGGAGLNFAGAGRVWTQHFNPRRTLIRNTMECGWLPQFLHGLPI